MINLEFLNFCLTSPRLLTAGITSGQIALVVIIIAVIVYFYLDNKKAEKSDDVSEQDNIIKSEASQVSSSSGLEGTNGQELANDTQLVAVITAAIMASMEEEGMPVPEDGLIIRSIRRKTTYR